jgi:hypothetical protein
MEGQGSYLMADNPKYQRQNIVLAETQPFQFADIKESIASSKSLQSGLDRLSKFAFEQAAETAKKEGMLYGVTNRPSLQQLGAALKQGINPNDLFSEDYTVFGQAAKAVQAQSVRQDLELDTREKFAEISAALESGVPFDLEKVTTEMDAMVNGFSKVLSSVDAEETMKYRASASTSGYLVYQKALEIKSKQILADNQAKADLGLRLYEQVLPDVINATNGNVIEIKAMLAPEKDRLDALIARTGGKQYDYKAKFAEMEDTAYANSIIDYALKSSNEFVPPDSTVFKEMRRGNVGKLSSLFSVLPKAMQRKIEEQVIKDISNSNSLMKIQNEEKALVNEKEITNIEIKVARGEMTGMEALTEMKKYKPLTREDIDALLKPQSPTADQLEFGQSVKRKIEFGEIGFNDLKGLYKKGQISGTQYEQLGDYYSNQMTQLKSGLQVIHTNMGIKDINDYFMLPTLSKSEVNKLVDTLAREADKARKEGKPFDQVKTANDIMKQYKVDSVNANVDLALKSISDNLPKDKDNKPIVITTENYSLFTDEKLKELKLNKDERSVIERERNNLDRILRQGTPQ